MSQGGGTQQGGGSMNVGAQGNNQTGVGNGQQGGQRPSSNNRLSSGTPAKGCDAKRRKRG
jgi:hypothetical protein